MTSPLTHELVTAILKRKTERLLLGKPIGVLQLNSEEVLTLKKFAEPFMISCSADLSQFHFSGTRIYEIQGIPPFINRPD